MTFRQFLPLLLVLTLSWSGALALFLVLETRQAHEQSIELAAAEARANANKDKAARLWGTTHGDIYVPAKSVPRVDVLPDDFPERDIETPSGKKLTLMNPAYIIHQIMKDFSGLYGISSKITTFPDKLMNRDNQPDAWEMAALTSISSGADQFSEIQEIEGQPYFRLMQPLYIQQECLKCHGFQGYQPGDLRGGISVAVPMQRYLKSEKESLQRLYVSCAALWVLGLISILLFWRYSVRKQAEENQREINRELELLSALDGLTGIANRRTFDLTLEYEWKRAKLGRQVISLLMIDIDYFKRYNDLYGHQAGDTCLKKVAEILDTLPKRAGDQAFRYGGEEFAVLLPNTGHEQAMMLAERYRKALADEAMPLSVGIDGIVTISIGVASSSPEPDSSEQQLVADADRALYRAKERGRNRVVSFDTLEAEPS